MKKINISGGIGYDYTAEQFRESIKNESQDLDLHISSGGGSVYEAFEIYNEMVDYRKKTGAKIIATLNGIVASAASYIAMGADERIAYDNSVFMIHNAGMVVAGDHRIMGFWADDLKKTDNVIATAYSKATGKSKQEVLNLMAESPDNNGTYFYGADIVENGFANRMIESGEDLDKQNGITQGKINYINFAKTLKPEEYDHERITAMLNIKEEKGATVTKEEILNGLANLKTNNGVTLPEIAKHLKLDDQLITDDQKAKLNDLDGIVKLCGDKKPADLINEMLTEKKENAVKVRNAALTEAFGTEVYETTKKTNKARKYAETLLGKDELTEEKINEIKADEIYLSLAGEHADIDSKENILGISESIKKENKVEEY